MADITINNKLSNITVKYNGQVATHIPETTDTTLVFYPNVGYTLANGSTSTIKASYEDAIFGGDTDVFQSATTNYDPVHDTYTIKFQSPSSEDTTSFDLTGTANVAPKPTTVKITQKLVNATSDLKVTEIPYNKPTSINLKANDGYIFANNGEISYFDQSQPKTEQIITKTGNNSIALTFTPKTTNDYTLSINATKKVPKYNFSSEEDNCTVNIDQVTENNVLDFMPITSSHLTATAETGYTFKVDGGLYYVDKDNNLNLIKKISANGTNSVSIDYDISHLPNIISPSETNVILLVIATEISKEPGSYALTANTDNVDSIEIDGTQRKNNDDIPDGAHHIKLTASDNCIFDKAGTQIITSSGHANQYEIKPSNTDILEFETYQPIYSFTNFSVNATKSTLADTGGFVNIYTPKSSEVSELSSEAIAQDDNSLLNDTSYIKAYYRIPFKINNKYLQSNVPFMLAKYKSKQTTTQVLNDTIPFDLGTITVPETYNSSYDYQNTTCVLYLPFVSPITLPSQNVVNKKIRIKYIMDMYTGNTTILIIDELTNVTFMTKSFKISSDLPFIQNINDSAIANVNNIYQNNIRNAYIIVSRSKPLPQNFGYPTLENGLIGNYKGYLKCSDIELNSVSDDEDFNKIKELLQKGAFIK